MVDQRPRAVIGMFVAHHHRREGQIFNACELLPGNECQEKVYPDAVEKGIGVVSGEKFKYLKDSGKDLRW
jgi:hypothetical protein